MTATKNTWTQYVHTSSFKIEISPFPNRRTRSRIPGKIANTGNRNLVWGPYTCYRKKVNNENWLEYKGSVTYHDRTHRMRLEISQADLAFLSAQHISIQTSSSPDA